MKKLTIILALLLAILIPTSGAMATTLTYLDISPRDARETYYKDMFAAYTAANPDVTIEYESVPWAEAYSKVVVLGAANDLPDLFNLYPSWTTEFNEGGWVVPLDEYIASSGILDTLLPNAVVPLEKQKDDFGGIYGMFAGMTMSCIYVRSDWIKEELGVDYTDLLEGWTWDRYIQLVYELTNAEKNRYGISFRGGFGGVDRVMEYMGTMRAEPWHLWENTDNPETLDYLVDTAEDAELMTKYVSMYWDGCAPTDSINWGFAEMVDAFAGGLTGTLFNDMEVVATLLASDLTTEQWGVLPVPSTTDGKIFQGLVGDSYQYAISAHSENPDAAWDVMQFMLNDENVIEYCKMMTLFPIVKGGENDEFFSAEGPLAGFLYQLNYPELWQGESIYGPADVTQIRLYDGTSELQKVLAKSMSVEDWLKFFDDGVTEITKEYITENPDAPFGKIAPFGE